MGSRVFGNGNSRYNQLPSSGPCGYAAGLICEGLENCESASSLPSLSVSALLSSLLLASSLLQSKCSAYFLCLIQTRKKNSQKTKQTNKTKKRSEPADEQLLGLENYTVAFSQTADGSERIDFFLIVYFCVHYDIVIGITAVPQA